MRFDSIRSLPCFLTVLGLCGLAWVQAADTNSPVAAGEGTADYKICPQDIIIIHIVGEVELPIEYRVSAEGEIRFPFLESVKVAGKTPNAVASLIKDRLINEDFFVDPQVVVNVKEYRIRTVSVFGEVNKPGPVVLPAERRVDIVEAINTAGGLTRLAKKNDIRLTRKGKTESYKFNDLIEIQDSAKKIWLEPEDVIVVKESPI
jgi:polysaccharide export outer membrane protein